MKREIATAEEAIAEVTGRGFDVRDRGRRRAAAGYRRPDDGGEDADDDARCARKLTREEEDDRESPDDEPAAQDAARDGEGAGRDPERDGRGRGRRRRGEDHDDRRLQVTKIALDQSVVDPDDVETLEDLIVAALNDARAKAEESQKRMASVTGGMKIPGDVRPTISLIAGPVQALINEFSKLPTIGPKTAARLVFHLLNRPRNDARALAEAIVALKERVRFARAASRSPRTIRASSAPTRAATPR